MKEEIGWKTSKLEINHQISQYRELKEKKTIFKETWMQETAKRIYMKILKTGTSKLENVGKECKNI